MEEIPKHENENPPTELLPLQMPIKPIKPDSDENSQDEEDDDEDEAIVHIEGSYNPSDYEHLNTTPEIKELFQFIMHYTPQNIDLEHKLRPFIPDFIPAVGDIDAFIKVPPPNGDVDKLGLQVLDEPMAKQSDPTVLDLQLRAILKESTTKTTVVKSLDNADKRPKEIEAWVKNMGNLHRSKPPPTVHYTRNMPDIESLMQEWDPEFEEMLKQYGLPSGHADCSLDEYVELVCSLLDIPIYKSKVQSLHVLFTLYSEFRNLQHFNTGMSGSQPDEASQADRLIIQ